MKLYKIRVKLCINSYPGELGGINCLPGNSEFGVKPGLTTYNLILISLNFVHLKLG
jgi:hypothetical protein